jgi:hypothetical protein
MCVLHSGRDRAAISRKQPSLERLPMHLRRARQVLVHVRSSYHLAASQHVHIAVIVVVNWTCEDMGIQSFVLETEFTHPTCDHYRTEDTHTCQPSVFFAAIPSSPPASTSSIHPDSWSLFPSSRSRVESSYSQFRNTSLPASWYRGWPRMESEIETS